MRCPFCTAEDTKVIDSRLVEEGRQVRRRRACLLCNERFTTYELPELLMPKVIKRDGSRKLFDERRLRSGILRALEKRPVSTEAYEAAIHRIKQRARAIGEREIESQMIGEWVMLELQTLDKVAYIRFASVYRDFQDVKAFHDEINRLEKIQDS